MPLHYSDESKAPRVCECVNRGGPIYTVRPEPLGHPKVEKCLDCHGTGRINDGALPDVEVAFWTKDGAWHHTLPHVPTEEDRKAYPVSYPSGSDGPFYRWAPDAYPTEARALAAARKVVDTKTRAEMDREAAELNRCHVCGVTGGHRLVNGRDCPEMKHAPLTKRANEARGKCGLG